MKEWFENRWSSLLVCLMLLAATLVTFWPQLQNGFINYDDPVYVTLNQHVLGGCTWANVKWALTANCASNWHPLTLLSHMLDTQLFGLNPGGHHAMSLLLHAVNSVLFFLLFRLLTGSLWRSAFIAALFALHPLHVESVAWVSERKDVLSGFFFMLTLLAYASYARKRDIEQGTKREERRGKSEASRSSLSSLRSSAIYILALVLFALGLLSKPMLVTLPFVLLLLDYWPLRRFQFPVSSQRTAIKKLLWEKLPFFALTAASCLATVLAQNKGEAISSLATVPFPNRLANAALSCVAYLGQTVWPARLSVFYPRTVEPSAAAVFGCVILLVVLTGLALRLARSRPFLCVGWFWYLGMLVPVIGLVQVGDQARADRYTYLPSLGVLIIVVWGVAELVQTGKLPKLSTPEPRQTARAPRAPKRSARPVIEPRAPNFAELTLLVVGAVLLVPLACAAHRQVHYWRDSRTLFTHAVNVDSNNYVAWQCLGIADLEQNDPSAALANFMRALECARRFGQENGYKYFVGATLQLLGRGIEALPYLEQAVVGPDFRAQRAYRLGLSLTAVGRLAEAEAALSQAVASEPDVPEFQLGLAALYEQKGQPGEALGLLEHLVEAHPENATAQRALADQLISQNRPAEAEPHYAQALKLTTPTAGLRQAYATALASVGKTADALNQLRLANQQEPNNPAVNLSLGELLAEQGNNRAAIDCYEKCLAIEPKSVNALNNLAWMLATASDNSIRNGPRAIELAQRACEVTEWKEAFLLGTLAAAYAEAGRFPDAVATAQKARDLARANKLEEVVKKNEELLALYRAGKPYHEAP